jgi:hypothetical protein
VAIHQEVFLAVGYAIFLVCVSLGLDSLARHSHARSERYRTAGFTYHRTNDAWICPEDQLLLRTEVDHGRRLIRYRGRPQICNSCPTKPECTDSDEGREVVHAMDPWPHSEAGRFHRVIAVMLVVLGALVAVVGLARNHRPAEAALLVGLLLACGFSLRLLVHDLRVHPANFPEPSPSEGLRMRRP